MRFQLVLQFPSHAKSYDDLVTLENALIPLLGTRAVVDGHDFGSGEGNIFIFTDEPSNAFAVIREALDPAALNSVRVAFRERKEGSRYQVLWPESLSGFRIA